MNCSAFLALSKKIFSTALITALIAYVAFCQSVTAQTSQPAKGFSGLVRTQDSGAASARRNAVSRALLLNDKAYALIARKQFAQALPLCREAVRLSPRFAEARKNHAICLLHTGRKPWSEALQQIKVAVQLAPNFAKAHDVKGQIHFNRNEHSLAIRELETAIFLNPRYSRAYYDLGMVYGNLMTRASSTRSASQMQQQSEKNFEKAAQFDPTEAEYFYRWGMILEERGERRGAIEKLKRTLILRPKLLHVHHCLLRLYDESGQDEEAISAGRAALKLFPNDYHINYNTSIYLTRLNAQANARECERLLRRALRTKPDSVEALNNLSVNLMRQNKHQEAMTYIQKILRNHPDFHGAPILAGDCYYALDNKNMALQYWRKANQSSDDYIVAMAQLRFKTYNLR